MRTLMQLLIALVVIGGVERLAAAQPYQYEVRLLPEVPNSDPNETRARALNDSRLVTLNTLFGGDQRAYYTDGTNVFRIPGIAAGHERNTTTCINNLNEIGGSAFIDGGSGFPPALPYVYSAGVVTALAIPDGQTGGVPQSLNNTGLAVGSSFLTNLPVVWDRVSNTASVITVPTMDTGIFWDVNDAGTAVGSWSDAVTTRAFVYDESGPRNLLGLGGSVGFANAINSQGHIVGSVTDASGALFGVLWLNETPTIVTGIPNTLGTRLLRITDSGVILGTSLVDDETLVSFLHFGGQNYLFDSMIASAPVGFGGVLGIRDINNNGDAIGSVLIDGQARAALLVAIPSPNVTIALALAGSIGLGRRRRTN